MNIEPDDNALEALVDLFSDELSDAVGQTLERGRSMTGLPPDEILLIVKRAMEGVLEEFDEFFSAEDFMPTPDYLGPEE